MTSKSEDLQSIIDELSDAYTQRSARQSIAMLVIKVLAIIIGSVVAGVAQFAALPDGEFPLPNAIGMLATVVVGLGGLYVTIFDFNASDELDKARRAVEAARRLRAELENTLFLFANLRQTTHLCRALREIRDVVERSLYEPFNEAAAIQLCLRNSERSLKLAFDFALQHHWTISVYKANPRDCYPAQLECVAHLRSVACDIKDARKWPEGIGVTGIAFARGTEVIVPDLAASQLGSLHDVTSNSKPEDGTRYRSIIGVPIVIGQKNDQKWGIVVATSDQPHHFTVGSATPDSIPTTEPARALAAMIALLLSANSSRNAQASSSPPPSPIAPAIQQTTPSTPAPP